MLVQLLIKFKPNSVKHLSKNIKIIISREFNEYSHNSLIDPSIGLNEEQRELQSMAYQFAVNEFRPHMKEWDQNEYLAIDKLRKAARLGFGGIYTPAEKGGTGLTRLDTSIVIEALAQGCVSTTALLSIHNMVCAMIAQFGDDRQVGSYVPDLVSMNKLGSYCLTEPNAGSDAANLQTKADKSNDYYILNGTKSFISGGGESDIFLVMARTGGTGSKGISCFIVEKGSPGLSFGIKESKLGWNSQPTRQVILEDCRVSASNLLGKEGYGFNIAMSGINGGRVNIASCSLGGAQWALEDTLKYTCDRKQFGQAIADFQNSRFELASMSAELLASRLSVRMAAKAIDDKQLTTNTSDISDENSTQIPVSTLCAMSKLLATEKCHNIIDRCLQLFGGYGYLKDYPIEQLLRDTRVHRILEGTNEIMKVIIAKDIIDKHLHKN
ncbi:isobutyryl-CoA dehydrogenase, mitochondrial-like [Oppia nitens]|uniref:isobutyryl-CoA dehydrogenase, mitochondrial-like n=1 Tax=Oppia nitens TaxID=1686743 RepID=UPI0023DB3382|nr:isobutyryl-CoA dehydrogenase, mitochondrial-like [Oppia nitens]